MAGEKSYYGTDLFVAGFFQVRPDLGLWAIDEKFGLAAVRTGLPFGFPFLVDRCVMDGKKCNII